MSTIEKNINERLSSDLAQRNMIDINSVAAAIQRDFPTFSLQQVADMVTAAVIAARGNAAWDGAR